MLHDIPSIIDVRLAGYACCWADRLRWDVVNAIGIAALCLAASAAPSIAEGKPCTREEAMQAEATAAYLSTWPEILGSFQEFGHCDDGAIAEGYSIAVGETLADRWSQVADLQQAIKSDTRFLPFILRHINETVPPATLDRLVANAAVRCPRQAKDTCEAILKRVQELQTNVRGNRGE